MDIEGKYFPDEEDEHSSKTGKRIGKYIFRFIAFLSAVVYIICFARIFSSCDSSLLEDVTFSERALDLYYKSPDDFVVYGINTKDFMEYYGTIVLSDVAYAETAGEIEIGIKYNTKITDTEENNVQGAFEEYPLTYRLYDQKGSEYSVCNRINTEKGRYKFERVCFSGLSIDFSQNDLNTGKYYASGEDVYFDTEESQGGEKYTLEIYNPVTKETKSFVIYDNHTTYKPIKYIP